MSEDHATTGVQSETRVSVRPRLGTKICVLLGLSLLLIAIYFYYEPLHTISTSGGIFGCGSAADPPTDQFPKGVCGNLNDVNKLRALITGSIGLLVLILGGVFFGVNRTEVPRTPRGYISEDGQFRRGNGERSGGAAPVRTDDSGNTV